MNIEIKRVTHVEQELLSLPEYMRSLTVLSGNRITRSLVFCVAFSISLFALLSRILW